MSAAVALTDNERLKISAVVHQNYYMPEVFAVVEDIITSRLADQAELVARTRARIAEHKSILDRLADQEERVSFLGSDEAAARFVAAVSWPLERQENRDAWAVRLLTDDDDDLLNREAWQARARLQAAIDRIRAARAASP